MLVSIVDCVINHLIGHIFMMRFFLQFQVLIRLKELISFPNQSKDSFILIKLNTLYSWKECVCVNWRLWY